MRLVEHYTRSARLMTGMAATLGADLKDAIRRDEVQVSTLVSAVVRCADCAAQDDCTLWLAARAGRRMAAPPDYCRNRDLMARLRRSERCSIGR